MPDDLNLRTPPEFAPALQWLAECTDDAVDAGIDVLASPIYNRVAIFNALSTAEGWDRDNAKGVLRVLESLSDVQRLLDAPPDVIARSVTFDREGPERKILAHRLGRLLASPVLRMISRGRELAGEREHVLDDARILTDIRPLFAKGTTDILDGAIITHSLRLRYTGAAEPALHIALDRAHLELLQRLVKRALDKATHLEGELARLNVPYVEPGGDIVSEPEVNG